jgi:cytochrome P450
VVQTDAIDRSEMTWVTTYAEVEQLLKSPAFVPSLHLRSSAPLLDHTLMTLDVDDHLARRRSEVVMFSRAQLSEYELHIVAPTLRASVERALTAAGAEAKVDILQLMRHALLRVTARIVGLDDVDSPARAEELRVLAEAFGEAASAEWAHEGQAEIVAQSLRARDRFHAEFFLPSLRRRIAILAEQRAGRIGKETVPNDLLTILLSTYGGREADLLAREIIFFIVASSNTTTHSAPHVLHDLLTWYENHPGDRARCGELSFLQRAVSESLRLHPTVPALLRMAREDVTLPSGRSFVKGEHIVCDLTSSNVDPDVFGPTAHVYNPHRELTRRVPFYGHAFGGGSHTCLGRTVAVGAGNGSIDRHDAPAGVLVRLLEELFRFDPRLDPLDPPVLRDDTDAVRYERFPIRLRRRTE